MNKFKEGLMLKKYKLPYSWDGTGAVVYGQISTTTGKQLTFFISENKQNILPSK